MFGLFTGLLWKSAAANDKIKYFKFKFSLQFAQYKIFSILKWLFSGHLFSNVPKKIKTSQHWQMNIFFNFNKSSVVKIPVEMAIFI